MRLCIVILLLLLLFLSIFNSCKKESETFNNLSRKERINIGKAAADAENKELNWQKTSFGLWKSRNGDLAIKSEEGTDVGISIVRYISELTDNGKPIKDVVDTATFRSVGNFFYKDKNHVYTHFLMVDGGNFRIVEGADPITFEALGNCYAKDKNFIYGERAMKMDSVDYKSFKTCSECACYAKDKNGFYFWDEKMTPEDLIVKEVAPYIDRLRKL